MATAARAAVPAMQRPDEVSVPPGPPRGRLGLPAPRPLPLPLPAPPPQPQPASPALSTPLSALYRSAFAQECEAIVLQLQQAGAREDPRWPEPPPAAPPPPPRLRLASTIEDERLTPLEPSYAWTPPSRRSQQPPGSSSRPDDECQGEASTAGPSPSSSSYTDLCEERSPRLSPADVAGARFARRRTFEWELPADADAGGDGSAPLVTSTPLLLLVAAEADQGPEAAAQRRGSALLRSAPQGPAGRPKPGSGGKTTPPRGSSALRKKLVSTAAAKRSALRTRRKGLLAPEAGPRGAGLPGACLQRSGGPGASAGSAGQSQALAKKQLPVETKKAQTKLPCSKRLPLSTQPPSRLNRGPAAGAAGDNRIAKARAQKRPQEKPSDTVSTQKHPFLKQAYQGRGQTEKPTSGVLPAAGQTCRNPSGTGSAAFCFEGPRLLEENQRLLKENQRLLKENQRLLKENQRLKISSGTIPVPEEDNQLN